MYRLAHVEDDYDIQNSVRDVIAGSTKIVLEFATDGFETALAFYRSRPAPHLLLLDINLAGLSGIVGLPVLRRHFPDCQIIIHTMLDDDDKIFQAICNGASGYLLKSTPFQDLEDHLMVTLNSNGSPITPSIARRILNHFQGDIVKKKRPENVELTNIERSIIQLLIDSYSYIEIANRMGMTVDGIRYYVKRIYSKLQVNSRSQLIAQYIKK